MTTVVAHPVEAAFDEIAAELAAAHVPGLELAVVRDGEVLFAGGVGVRGVTDEVPVGGSTLFHHGSCGKAYTGLLGAMLAADGLLDLDVPVRRYVPELRLPDAFLAERITVRDLLSHRSGLGRHDLAWIFNPTWTTEELVRRLEHLPLVGDLRTQFSYSNFGFALAGFAMTRAAGTDWSTLVQSRIFDPLGMTRTHVTAVALQTDTDAATPHVVRDGRARPTVHRVLNGIAPAGEIISCAEDSARWLLAQLGDGPIGAEVLAVPQSPQMLLPAVSPFAEMELDAAGFGWLTGRYRGNRMLWHNGGVDGFTTQTLLLPAQRIGIVASANVFPTELPLAVVLKLADALLSVPSGETWFDRLLRAGEATSPEVPAQPAPAAPCAHPLADYAGRYVHPGFGDLDVGAGAELSLRIGDYDLEARHRGYETWELRYDPLDADGTVTFVTGPTGAVVEARLELEPGEVLPFVRQDATTPASK